MIESVQWYERAKANPSAPLVGTIQADAVVVGGGMAGLSAAQWLAEEGGQDVVLIEARFCGAGATGRSSGFITPDSELQLHELARRFGDADARLLWDAACSGVEQIRRNVDSLQMDCDRVQADSLYVARTDRAASVVREEHEAHRRLGFGSDYYEAHEVPQVLGTGQYRAAVRYDDTFSINGYLYAQGLKKALIQRGVRVYEGTPALHLEPNEVITPRGMVRARHVFVCLDRYAPELGAARRESYHAQTFLALSEPLDEATLRRIFPAGPMLVWDTDLIYQYFRPTADHRLLVGGGSLWHTYRREASHGQNGAVRGLIQYAKEQFPFLSGVRFTHYWPGLIGVTRDLLPMAGPSPQVPGHSYAMCSAGLPWSALAGRVAAQRAIEGATPFDRFFDPARAFSPLEPLQPLLRKPATFALSHYFSKNYQKGHPDRTARQRRWVRRGLWMAAGLAAAFAGAKTMHKARQLARVSQGLTRRTEKSRNR